MSRIISLLERAEKYCLERGDEAWFYHCYTIHRESYCIKDSLWKTMSQMYSDEVANNMFGGADDALSH